MYKSKFTLSDTDDVFEGYTDGSLWNGWANVCFTREQIKNFMDTTPYNYKFIESGTFPNLIEGWYPLLVVYWDMEEEVYHSTSLPTDNGDILEGYFLDGLEFMEIEKWEVQEFTFCDGWINTWSDKNEEPLYFKSEDEAKQELDDFLFDQSEAVENGAMVDKYDIENYRIVKVFPKGE